MHTESSDPACSNEMRYFLGAPVWACDAWVGSLYTSKSRKNWLSEYSSVFNTVEGNSTFYALPPLETIRRWADQAQDGFRFCLKFPGAITHEKQLIGAHAETEQFLACLEVLHEANRLGPSFLQLPPFFSSAQLEDLSNYLAGLPKRYRYAVEARHLDYFDDGSFERSFDALLREHGMDRVLFDSRALFSRAAEDEHERISQRRKPKSPLRHTVTGRNPFVRFVGRNKLETVQTWIDEWADVVSGWINEGLTPFIFMHAPDDKYGPEFAELFHAAVSRQVTSLKPLNTWPGRSIPKQRQLF